jgi:hypothetical protein
LDRRQRARFAWLKQHLTEAERLLPGASTDAHGHLDHEELINRHSQTSQ